MAVQSLYRRYRPRRFDELKGQDHVVRALRNAVINHREGQAYLFSGPRGTGKTSTARILAKVLNCEAPDSGEPCGVCNSCASIDSGNSYDVLELDAASNNGVENMRDLIERSSLGNPGRHRVFILDEVHMLSKPAEAALLKTLEEPPPHVVFVLATTDPQKVSETIRSRTQHLQFHLLPIHDLEEHVRFVIQDANLKVSEQAIRQVLERGGGSARDTLSALELIASSGGEVEDAFSSDDVITALIRSDAGAALVAMARAMQLGTEPRALAEEIIRHLRECFLSQMAPELVQRTDDRRAELGEQARQLGTVQIVKAIERLGEVLIEMRHSPDPRVMLEVAMVGLTKQGGGDDLLSLISRIERLESGVVREPSAPVVRPAPINPSTGKAQLGGKASSGSAPSAPATATEPASDSQVMAKWPEVVSSLKPLVRALYSVVTPLSVSGDALLVSAPNATHVKKAEEHQKSVEVVIEKVLGRSLSLQFSAAAPKDPTSPTQRIKRPVADDIDVLDPKDVAESTVATTPSAIDQLTKAFPGSQVVDKPKKS
ncbi:MAG: polymerase gamma/tau subunit [Actinomycetota bacterium]|jgi:DNA polymerase-3 subunit gamma/tau